MTLLFVNTNVLALKTATPTTNLDTVKGWCKTYYKCVTKEIKTAKEQKKKITSSSIQNNCQASRVTYLYNGNVDIDYCSSNSFFDVNKSMNDLLKEAEVKASNDIYIENKEKCASETKAARKKACGECQKCVTSKGKTDIKKDIVMLNVLLLVHPFVILIMRKHRILKFRYQDLVVR